MHCPRPINRQRLRSLVVPCRSRGYHVSGAITLRPSARSTASASFVTVTRTARLKGDSLAKELIPRPHKTLTVVFHQALDLVELAAVKATAALQAYRIHPELRRVVVALDV